jgi:tRNA-specific 2-thiouridylase
MHNTLEATHLDWVNNKALTDPLACTAKTRYRQTDQDCSLEPLGNNRCRVVFKQAQRAITPGQSVVFYNGEICLGGGIIELAYNS